ncbi:ABC transporter permease [Kocuria oceani]|uniref:ABC transporter permease n=1 Tax=Kocuria oceani TaxID=988827 RepID=UPI00240754DD|nr:ABC transporter permease subunit [Kocuria oceani]
MTTHVPAPASPGAPEPPPTTAVRPAGRRGAGTAGRQKLPPWIVAALGVVSTVAVWWLGAATVLRGVGAGDGTGGGAVPTPPAIVRQIASDGAGFYWANASVTIVEAAQGYLGGNAAAVLLAAAALLLPFTERLATQIAVVSYCLPIVAVGPIIFIVVGPPRSGEPSGTAVTLAAISVFFTTYVSVLAGFRTAERSTLDVVTVAGGSRWDQLVKVRLVSALPGVFTALKIAAPAALLGAILGEYVGGVDRGMGPAMVNAQQSLEVARVWAVALVSGGLAFLAYALVGTVARFVTPWSSGGREVGR